MLRFGCLTVLILLIAIPVVASRFLPWSGTIGVMVAQVLLLMLLGPRILSFLIRRMALKMLQTKSRVLQQAMLHVHRVSAVDAADSRAPALIEQADDADTEDSEEIDELDGHAVEEDDDRAPVEDLRHVEIEFTLTPQPNASQMAHYEPWELLLVPFDATVSMEEDDMLDANSAAVESMHLIDERGRETEDFDKLTGRARLRAVFAIPPTLQGRVKFRYYFEQFGEVLLPSPIPE